MWLTVISILLVKLFYDQCTDRQDTGFQKILVNSGDFILHWFSKYNYATRNYLHTLKCLSIGTLKTIDIPYIPNGKLMFFRCPSI